MTRQWQDSAQRYGIVTRALHGAMALLFAWQFLGMALKVTLGRTPLVAFFVGQHASVGLLLLGLIILRAAWALCQRARRPADAGWSGVAARAGHAALYLLMIVVPLLAVLRAYASGRGAALWGVQIVPAGHAGDPALIALGNAWHGVLAWCLLVLIAGHVAAALWHRLVRRDAVVQRMFGRAPSARETP